MRGTNSEKGFSFLRINLDIHIAKNLGNAAELLILQDSINKLDKNTKVLIQGLERYTFKLRSLIWN